MNRYLLIFSVFTAIGFFISCKDKQTIQEEVVNKEMKEQINSTEKPESTKKTILCFGNSLTAGYGLEEDQSWPSLLQQKLDSLELNYNVINAGLSGETSSGGLNRIEWVLNQPVDIFILELGGNDMLRGIAFQNTRENLFAIIEKVKNHNPDIKIIIAGMLAPPNMGGDYEKGFNSLFPELAKSNNASLIPFFLENVVGIPELNLADAKHPNAKGQKIVLENVWAALESQL